MERLIELMIDDIGLFECGFVPSSSDSSYTRGLCRDLAGGDQTRRWFITDCFCSVSDDVEVESMI